MKIEHWHLSKANAINRVHIAEYTAYLLVCAFGPSYIIVSNQVIRC